MRVHDFVYQWFTNFDRTAHHENMFTASDGHLFHEQYCYRSSYFVLFLSFFNFFTKFDGRYCNIVLFHAFVYPITYIYLQNIAASGLKTTDLYGLEMNTIYYDGRARVVGNISVWLSNRYYACLRVAGVRYVGRDENRNDRSHNNGLRQVRDRLLRKTCDELLLNCFINVFLYDALYKTVRVLQ